MFQNLFWHTSTSDRIVYIFFAKIVNIFYFFDIQFKSLFVVLKSGFLVTPATPVVGGWVWPDGLGLLTFSTYYCHVCLLLYTSFIFALFISCVLQFSLFAPLSPPLLVATLGCSNIQCTRYIEQFVFITLLCPLQLAFPSLNDCPRSCPPDR